MGYKVERLQEGDCAYSHAVRYREGSVIILTGCPREVKWILTTRAYRTYSIEIRSNSIAKA